MLYEGQLFTVFACVLMWGYRHCQVNHAPGTVGQSAGVDVDVVFAGQLVDAGQKRQQAAVPLGQVRAVEADPADVTAGLQLLRDIACRGMAVSQKPAACDDDMQVVRAGKLKIQLSRHAIFTTSRVMPQWLQFQRPGARHCMGWRTFILPGVVQ